MDYTDATQAAAHIGQGIAFVFGFLGLFFDPFLLFIALFVWVGASGEAAMVQMRTSLGGIPVQQVMYRDIRTLQPDDTLAKAVEQILSGWQQDFPVVYGRESEYGASCPSCAPHIVCSWFILARDLMLPTERYGGRTSRDWLPLANDAESIHTLSMSLKSAALLALIGTILLTVLVVAHFISTLLGVMREMIPAMALLTSLVHLFASLSVLVFFYVFYRKQS